MSHMAGFYPFAFNSMRNNSPFDLLANGGLFGRFGADLPKEMAALCKYLSLKFQIVSVTSYVNNICKQKSFSALIYKRRVPTH